MLHGKVHQCMKRRVNDLLVDIIFGHIENILITHVYLIMSIKIRQDYKVCR